MMQAGPSASPDLPRRFGLLHATALNMTNMIGVGQYVRYLWPAMTPAGSAAIIVGVGILCIALLYRRIHSIGIITVSLWAGTLLTVLAVILSGAPHFRPAVAFDFPQGAFDLS